MGDFKVTFDAERVNAWLRKATTEGINDLDKAVGRTAAEAGKFIKPVTPKKTGNLRRSYLPKKNSLFNWQYYSIYGDSGASAHPYGIYQENGYTNGPVKNYTTPGTGAHFLEKNLTGVERLLKSKVETVLKKYFAT